MSWDQYRSVMERYAIKTDDMATEDAYFMATHMPFSQLEVYQGGRTSSVPKLLNEDEVFDQLIYNPENDHRMIIVRGDNGAGKSHLIRFLKAKFENCPSTVYNPATEQLIFLRRLNNSVRGAFLQIIEQNIIEDSALIEKLRKFVESSDSKDETSFKTDILYAYVAAVRNDTSGTVYRSVICRDIASYLADSRVSDHLLREGGAIAKCYNMITAPSDRVLNDTSIFTEEDFNVSKILREVIKQGDPQAADFATTLKSDDYEITRLVNYLNKFSREVVQRCADISSESTKDVFVQLRKDLKKQGKNLTLFIEDFTGFTGIDSELITVLSTEHGGDYKDLCRVTSVVGITNYYYDQFKENFTDRVTHQISVTDRSYGTDDFLVQMTGRYLNAIFCDPNALRKWYDDGADYSDLPVGILQPPCEWETTTIGGKTVSLYPFNRNALRSLYDCLPAKSPRMFLKEVIRAQLKEYFDGKKYGDEWSFPLNPGNRQMSRDRHSSTIDRLDSISVNDKNRLKAVFALWGDGSASGVKNEDGTIFFGGVNSAFLADIGLESFNGIGDIVTTVPESTTSATNKTQDAMSPVTPTTPKEKQTISPAKRDYLKYKTDITSWYTQNEPLKYDQDYREWIRAFICGERNQCGAINWQDIGVPAYIAEERLKNLESYYIDDQSVPANVEKAIVFVDRSVESRDALLTLNELNYAKSWDFDGATYYQQKLITWLERRKTKIIENVTAVKQGAADLPILKWCLCLQYLKACILGHKIDMSTPYTVIDSLFNDFQKDDRIKRDTREWNDLIQFVLNKNADFDSVLKLLKKSSATTMGAIHYSADPNTKACYRANELVIAVESLIEANWDIESELPQDIPQKHLLFNPATLLKALYPNIRKAMAAVNTQSNEVLDNLKSYIGELTQENLIDALAAIQELFAVFGANSIIGSNDLKTKYDKAPIDTAKKILKHVDILKKASSASAVKQLIAYTENSLNALYDLLRDIQTIAQKAEHEEANAKKEIAKTGSFSGAEQLSEAALECMKELYAQLESMEVYDNATN